MAMGKSVIKQALQERLGEAPPSESSKIPLLISGLVMTEAFGIITVLAALRTTEMQERVGWGFLTGIAFSIFLLAAGRRFSKEPSGLSPWKVLLRDFYAGLVQLVGIQNQVPSIRDTEAEMLSVLWSGGVISHRDLEGRLAQMGSPALQIRQALENLRGHDLISIRADGVSLGVESKRLFA